MALVGKPCPTLTGLTFVKGDPVAIPSRTGPMVVEIWATWCGPCRVAFPHLSQLAHKYRAKGLLVVGINMGEEATHIRNFVQQQGDKIVYTVAVDDSGAAAQALMGAAGVSGIPHAFIIDASGTVQHHGHPMEPKFAQKLDEVCSAAAAPPPAGPPKRELPPVSASREELAGMPVRALKQILEERGISYAGLAEKSELVDRILERCSNVSYTR